MCVRSNHGLSPNPGSRAPVRASGLRGDLGGVENKIDCRASQEGFLIGIKNLEKELRMNYKVKNPVELHARVALRRSTMAALK